MSEPNLRFKYDNGSSFPSWNEMPLGKLVTDNLDPVPTPQEGYRRVGIYCHAKGTFQEDVPAENVLDVDTMYRIHKDNLIVNITFAWEHAVAIVKPEDEGLLVSHRFPEYSFNEGQVPAFYKYLILRPYFKNQLSLASPGGAGRNRVLNKTQFKEIIVTVPCEAEQRKIADFLSSVDDVIAASEAEVQNLETQKKAVMKKIFSQEVRFKKADGTDFPEWESIRLGECFSFKNGINASREAFRSDGIKCIGVSDVYRCMPLLSKNIKGTIALSSKETARYAVEYGDILFQRSSETFEDIGHASVYVDNEMAVFNGFVICAKPNSVFYNPYYIHYAMQSDDIRAQTKRLGAGAQHYNIGQDSLSSLVLSIPSLKEQRLIADFLSDFDDAIAAAKKELELWKELKKGLLQQMFV